MKKLLTLLVLLPYLLFGQENPIVKPDRNINYICSVEQQFTKSKIKSKSTQIWYSQTQKESIDPIQYLLTNNWDDISSFLRDYNRSGKTDVFSDQNAMKVVEYFKTEMIQKIDAHMTDPNPSKFVEYFRAYDAAAWYQSEVNLYEPYIDELFKSIEILYNHPPYWEKTEELNDFRWNSTLLLDIEGRRADVYHLFVMTLEKSTNDFIGGGIPQVNHLNAISSIVWRSFVNRDSQFISKFLRDQRVINLYFNVIDNQYLVGDFDYIISNFIRPVEVILKGAVEEPNYDSTILFNMVSERFNATKFGENKHVYWVASLIRVNYDFGIDMDKIKSDYLNLEFNKTYEYDNGSIKIYSSIDPSRIESIYLGIRQTRANFFKLTGDTEPLESDPNHTINIYIFNDGERYSVLGGLLFNIPTNNGGIYVEGVGSLYTFDRNGDYLPIDFLVNHEYAHYLDSRYNIEGAFAESKFYDWSKSVFWVEGLASFTASARSRTGFGIAYSNAYQVADDVNQNSTITLKESIKTSYNNWRMYPYSEAAWGFLYKYMHNDLMTLFTLLKSNDINGYFTKLDQIINNQALEPLYQDHLISIKNQFNSGLTDHDPLISYDFTEDKISNDSIQIAFQNLGLSNFTLKQSYQTPFEYTVAQKDTIVSSLKNVNEYLQFIIKESDSIDSSYYSGYKIISGQIDRYERVGNNYKVYYSFELPTNGSFYVNEEEEETTDPVDPTDPIDPVDPVDPVDPIDPEPIITELVLYPNPTVSEINVINLPIYSQIYIYDMQGRIHYNKEHVNGDFKLDVSRLSTGMYILVHRSHNATGTIKFIKN